MTSDQVQQQIRLLLLRQPLTIEQLASELQEPTYRIRGELHAMKRDRQVAELYNDRAQLLWQMTGAGLQVDQTTLEVRRILNQRTAAWLPTPLKGA